jgi:hypothetical protein
MNYAFAGLLALALSGPVLAAEKSITPEIQALLDAHKKVIAGWAADPVIVTAVQDQNISGPLSGVDNEAWKKLDPENLIVKRFQQNPAGMLLARKLKEANGVYAEAFVCAAKGEKVAFVEKTTSYIHAGTPKFDVPMSGKDWQGEPAFDESSQINAVQISTPVLDDKGHPIGVLVVGIAIQ